MNIKSLLKRVTRYRNNEDINIDELINIMKMNEESILLDVRSIQEYNEGHLNRSY